MTSGQVSVFVTAVVGVVVGVAFLVIYTVRAPWWRDPVGRVLWSMAAAITLLNGIAATGSSRLLDLEVVRHVRAGLTVVIVCGLAYQIYLTVARPPREDQ